MQQSRGRAVSSSDSSACYSCSWRLMAAATEHTDIPEEHTAVIGASCSWISTATAIMEAAAAATAAITIASGVVLTLAL
jgi:hypothetical protein